MPEIGQTVSHFRLVEKIGSGGMGVVYKAEDTILGRQVAIKILPEVFADDPERLRRFGQEARSASALNHPNIITIFEIGKHGATPYIVMEFVDGKTLRKILADGPLPTKKLLQFATQIAEGLAKSHSAGIVHRDLKPENLMVTSEGYVKILDFGLSKLVPQRSGFDFEMATVTMTDTRQGVLLGTIPYMSPEQASGKPVNYRSDQFALGSILYEMATGKLLFKRETAPKTLTAIIEEKPTPMIRAEADLPEHFQTILERSLAKDPEERYDSTRDLARDLKEIRDLFMVSQQSERVERKPRRSKNRRKRRSRIKSLVVLPLANLSADPEQEYFADGMTEALITNLAKIGALKVISRTSAMSYKGTEKLLPEIARELAVDGVVEGSVLRAGERVRITAQLIRAETDEHLWAESYERDLRDILSLQSEVSQAIAREIKIKLSPGERERMASTRPVNPEAHEAYLKGRYYYHMITKEGMKKAVVYLHQALDGDPGSALAHAALAELYVALGFSGYNTPREVMPKAKAAALKAIEVDETISEGHRSLGWIKFFFEWDWPAAETEFKRAIELNPNDAIARSHYSGFLVAMGRFEEGIAQGTHSHELDPLSLPLGATFASSLVAMGRYDEAIEQCRKILEMDPNIFWANFHRWSAFRKKEMYEEAVAECRKFFSLWGNTEVSEALQSTYAKSGYKDAMQEGADILVAQAKAVYVIPTLIAIMYAHAEEKDQACEWLEKAYEEHDPFLVEVKTVPAFNDYRPDPRFQQLLRRMNFPE
jgi:serine/threonine protein kinase/Tfp pilus assembly protein PilF